jgi:hypothetical protein
LWGGSERCLQRQQLLLELVDLLRHELHKLLDLLELLRQQLHQLLQLVELLRNELEQLLEQVQLLLLKNMLVLLELLKLLHLLRQDVQQLLNLLQRLRVVRRLGSVREVAGAVSGNCYRLQWLIVRRLCERLRADRVPVRRDSPGIGLPELAGSDSERSSHHEPPLLFNGLFVVEPSSKDHKTGRLARDAWTSRRCLMRAVSVVDDAPVGFSENGLVMECALKALEPRTPISQGEMLGRRSRN